MNFQGLIFLDLKFIFFLSQLLFRQSYCMKGSHKQGRKRRPTAGAPVHMAGIFSAARATRTRHPHCPDPVSSRQHGWREFVIRSLRYSSNPIVTLVKWAKRCFIGGERVNSVLPLASSEPGLIFLGDSTSTSSVVVVTGWSTSAGPLFFQSQMQQAPFSRLQ